MLRISKAAKKSGALIDDSIKKPWSAAEDEVLRQQVGDGDDDDDDDDDNLFDSIMEAIFALSYCINF